MRTNAIVQEQEKLAQKLLCAFGNSDMKAWQYLTTKLYLEAWLNECGTITECAKVLSISRRGLHKLIRQHRITFKNGGVR